MDNLRCLKRAEPCCWDRVIRATFFDRKIEKVASLYHVRHATPKDTILSRDFDVVVEILMICGVGAVGMRVLMFCSICWDARKLLRTPRNPNLRMPSHDRGKGATLVSIKSH